MTGASTRPSLTRLLLLAELGGRRRRGLALLALGIDADGLVLVGVAELDRLVGERLDSLQPPLPSAAVDADLRGALGRVRQLEFQLAADALLRHRAGVREPSIWQRLDRKFGDATRRRRPAG
jgi:hypothetical protein